MGGDLYHPGFSDHKIPEDQSGVWDKEGIKCDSGKEVTPTLYTTNDKLASLR